MSKNWQFGRVKLFTYTSSRWGLEVTIDFTVPALTIHVLNVAVVIEVW